MTGEREGTGDGLWWLWRFHMDMMGQQKWFPLRR